MDAQRMLIALGVMAAASTALAEPVEFAFKATNDLPFSRFELGDTVEGVFRFDDEDATGFGEEPQPLVTLLTRQDAPQADLEITFTDASTGQTAFARLDLAANAEPDLAVEAVVNNLTFKFENLTTDPNNVFGLATGISFETVLIRFDAREHIVPSLPLDFSEMTPAFVTMRIRRGPTVFGPNFAIDSVRQVPEPAGLVLLALAGVVGGVRGRRN